MITYKQYNFCRKIGLPPIPHVERYFSLKDILFGTKKIKDIKIGGKGKDESIDDQINKPVDDQLNKPVDDRIPKSIQIKLHQNCQTYLRKLVQQALKTGDESTLWYDPSGNIEDFKNIPNGKIVHIDSWRKEQPNGKLEFERFLVWWNCKYINDTGHTILIECAKNYQPYLYSIEG